MTGEVLVLIDHRLIDVGPTLPLEEANPGMKGVTMEVVVEGSVEVFVLKTGPNLLLEMRGLKGGLEVDRVNSCMRVFNYSTASVFYLWWM